MDADDYVIGDFNEILIDLKRQNSDIIFFAPTSINTVTQSMGRRHIRYQCLVEAFKKESSKEHEFALKYNFYVPWSKIIKNEIIKNNKIRFSDSLYANDVIFSIKTAYFAKTIFASDLIFYCITENEFGLTKELTGKSIKVRNKVQVERFCFLMCHVPIKYWKQVEVTFRSVIYVWGAYFCLEYPFLCLKEKWIKLKTKKGGSD